MSQMWFHASQLWFEDPNKSNSLGKVQEAIEYSFCCGGEKAGRNTNDGIFAIKRTVLGAIRTSGLTMKLSFFF